MSMLLRRQMMRNAGGGELYPVGTNIVKTYIRDTGIGWQENSTISSTTGEIVESSGNAASEAFMPIDPTYTYGKNGYRVGAAYYDESKVFIVYVNQNNTTEQPLTGIPQNARFMRIRTVWNSRNMVNITRTE